MANDVVFIGAIFALVCIGLYCVTQKSMIRILLGVEMMLNAGNLALVYFASYRIAAGFVDPLGQTPCLHVNNPGRQHDRRRPRPDSQRVQAVQDY